MSIKTVGQQTSSNTIGLEKRIAKGAEKLIYDVLQATQYSTPIPSTIRELVTNACDSQREKEIAIEILLGQAKVEDYFITRDGDEYVDSNFDPTYYDPLYLNKDEDRIYIKYQENEGTGFCDEVSILDFGVGLGQRRLEGMLELGYSTKRNTAENFGAFGLGSKVALSTGVPYYTIETCYNGKYFKMNCYPYKTDFVISKWDADGEIELSNGDKAYYLNKDSLNYTKITFGAKKHNRRAYKNAVEEQLSYFTNIQFDYVYEGGLSVNGMYSKNILLNTESIIVTTGSYYSKPHIVIVKDEGDAVGINYGNIDFRELEMEDMWGNIGIKCPIRQVYMEDGKEIVIRDGVDVTPSREKVVWNDATKKYVQGRIEKAADEAASIIQDSLKSTEFVDWLRACANILYHQKSIDDTPELNAMGELSRLIDKTTIKPKFNGTDIKFRSPKKMLPGVSLRKISTSYGKDVSRDDVSDWSSVNFDRLYLTNGSANKFKDMYLTSSEGPIFLLTYSSTVDKPEDLVTRETIWPLLADSPLVKSYDEVEIPEGYEETVNSLTQKDGLSPAELRKLQNKVVGHSLRVNIRHNHWVWDKVEPTIESVLNSTRTTYYCTRKDEHKIKFAANLLSGRIPTYSVACRDSYRIDYSAAFFVDSLPVSLRYRNCIDPTALEGNAPQLVTFSDSNIKYAEQNPHWKHIDEFFLTYEDGVLKSTEHTRPYFTAVVAVKLGLAPYYDYNWMVSNVGEVLFPNVHERLSKLKYMNSTCLSSGIDYSESDKTVPYYTELQDYMENLAEYAVDFDTMSVEARQARCRKHFVVDVPEVDLYDKDVIEFVQAIRELGDGINDFFGSIDRTMKLSTENITLLTDLLQVRNKFDVEIPEITVPEFWYKLKVKEQ